jgi:hypothetical protein
MTVVEKINLAVAISGDVGLPPLQRLVGILLLMHFHNTKTGQCNPSMVKLAKMTAASESTARRAVQALMRSGYLRFARNHGGRNIRNAYVWKTLSPLTGFSDAKKPETLSPLTENPVTADTRIEHRKENRKVEGIQDEASINAAANPIGRAAHDPKFADELFWSKRKRKAKPVLDVQITSACGQPLFNVSGEWLREEIAKQDAKEARRAKRQAKRLNGEKRD